MINFYWKIIIILYITEISKVVIGITWFPYPHRLLDNDGDGYITPAELRLLMSNMGDDLHDEEIHEMIKVVDQDGDGKVNFEGKYQRTN